MNPGTFAGTIPTFTQLGWKRQIAINSSITWTAPRTAYYTVTAIGAGGSGSAASSSVTKGCGGGGAGGFAQKNSVLLYAGTKIAITIGAGGASVSMTGSQSNGNSGGATIVSGGGLSLYAGGGGGGVYASGASVSGAGGAGGTASGGDLNYTGGAGGTATTGPSTSGTRHSSCGGGGAVSFWGFNTKGGDGTGNSNGYGAGGGGGVGGQGSDATNAGGAGGGIWVGASSSLNQAQPINDQTQGFNAYTALVNTTYYINGDLLSPNGYASAGYYDVGQGSGNATAGCGSGGLVNVSGGVYYQTTGNAYGFGGTGGAAAINPNSVTSGTAYYGGGTGGAFQNSGAAPAVSGVGGSGIVIITWVQQ